MQRGVFIQLDSLTVGNNVSNSNSGNSGKGLPGTQINTWKFWWSLQTPAMPQLRETAHFGSWTGWETAEASEKGSSLVAPSSHPSPPHFPCSCTWGVLWAFSGSLQKKNPWDDSMRSLPMSSRSCCRLVAPGGFMWSSGATWGWLDLLELQWGWKPSRGAAEACSGLSHQGSCFSLLQQKKNLNGLK